MRELRVALKRGGESGDQSSSCDLLEVEQRDAVSDSEIQEAVIHPYSPTVSPELFTDAQYYLWYYLCLRSFYTGAIVTNCNKCYKDETRTQFHYIAQRATERAWVIRKIFQCNNIFVFVEVSNLNCLHKNIYPTTHGQKRRGPVCIVFVLCAAHPVMTG